MTPGFQCVEASMVYITSFVLTSQPRIATAEALTEKALLQGARLCLNLSSVGLLQKVKESLMNLLPKCSFLFGNRGRTSCLCRAHGLDIVLQRRGHDEVLGDHVTWDGSDHSRCWADDGGCWWWRATLSCTTEPRAKNWSRCWYQRNLKTIQA